MTMSPDEEEVQLSMQTSGNGSPDPNSVEAVRERDARNLPSEVLLGRVLITLQSNLA